jgi:phospholipase C
MFDELAKDFQTEPDEQFAQVILVDPEFSDDFTLPHHNDNHPPLPMGPGEAFMSDMYRAVTINPDRWASTVLIVLYDEHGGFFDHVPPFAVTTSPPADNIWGNKAPFTTSGPRVPAIIVSPLVDNKPSHARFDHTAILQFIADTFAPGEWFSPEIQRRYGEGRLERLRGLIGAAPNPHIPRMPPMPSFTSVTLSSTREMTPGMEAFQHARDLHHQTDPLAFAQQMPRMAFNQVLPKPAPPCPPGSSVAAPSGKP